jgi:predicted methyltransferase
MTTNTPNRHQLRLLRQLLGGPKSPYHLIPFQDGTLPEFYEAYQQIKNNKWATENETHDLLTITDEGKKLTLSLTNESFSFVKCEDCGGRGYRLGPRNKTLLDKYSTILKDRPKPAIEYDQTPITDIDMLIRAGFMDERGDVAGKNVLLIGDADMLSIALGLSGLPNKVVVLDVDDRVIAFVNKIGKEHNLKIEGHKFDVRLPFPKEFRNDFDVFISDPVETVEGIKLFLSHGTAGLRGEGSVCYFGLTTLEAGTKKWFKIQEIMLKMSFVLTDVRRNFNEYYNTDFNDCWPIGVKLGDNKDNFLWYWTAFLRCEAVAKPVPLVSIDEGRELGVEIYRDDEAWATPPPK